MFGELPAWGFYIRHVEGLSMKNINLSIEESDYRPAIVVDDVQGLNLKLIQINGSSRDQHVYLKDCSEISLDSTVKLE